MKMVKMMMVMAGLAATVQVASGYSVVVIDDVAGSDGSFTNFGMTSFVNLDAAYYAGDMHYENTPGGTTGWAQWVFSGLDNGEYQVSASWPGEANATTAAQYSITPGGGSTTLVTNNQTVLPGDFTLGTGNFEVLLPSVTVTDGTLVVGLTDTTAGYLYADAIHISGGPPALTVGVELEDDFSGATIDAARWDLIDQGTNTTSVGLTGSGQLRVDLDGDEWLDAYISYGVLSKDAFSVGEGETLVVDCYGVNVNKGASNRSGPTAYVIAAAVTNTGWSGEDGNYAGLLGEWFGAFDLAMASTNTTSEGIGNQTYNAYKHYIVTVDATNTRVYLEDDFWENLASPTPKYTWDTTNVYTSAELAAGLRVLVGAEYRWTVLEGTAQYEVWDGVKVSVLANPSTPPSILGLSPVGGNMVEMVVDVPPTVLEYSPQAATDLVLSNWTTVAHSYTNDAGTLQTTNLSYSTTDGTNKVIYLNSAVDDAKFFRIIGE